MQLQTESADAVVRVSPTAEAALQWDHCPAGLCVMVNPTRNFFRQAGSKGMTEAACDHQFVSSTTSGIVSVRGLLGCAIAIGGLAVLAVNLIAGFAMIIVG